MDERTKTREYLIELRESTGMNRRQFCEYFEIPYMTVSDWEHGKKRVPKYFLSNIKTDMAPWERAHSYGVIFFVIFIKSGNIVM